MYFEGDFFLTLDNRETRVPDYRSKRETKESKKLKLTNKICYECFVKMIIIINKGKPKTGNLAKKNPFYLNFSFTSTIFHFL